MAKVVRVPGVELQRRVVRRARKGCLLPGKLVPGVVPPPSLVPPLQAMEGRVEHFAVAKWMLKLKGDDENGAGIYTHPHLRSSP